MAEIHILNVGQGDCAIFRSNSGRMSMIDICNGNMPAEKATFESILEKAAGRGNYQMCKHPTNPVEFIKNKFKATDIFRFILTHPDMDHLDGFSSLMENYTVLNFWDSKVRREKPDFSEGHYCEGDWDKYANVIENKVSGTHVVSPLAGAKNKYYNMDDKGTGGDYLSIYAPDSSLVEQANKSGEGETINDASYVIVYRSSGGRILFPGDAHDKTWEYVLKNYKQDLVNCELMIAPHHGRDSDRKWDFLDIIKPKFSILGCASSAHLAYDAWDSRGLEKITQNQSGNIAIYPNSEGLDIYIENVTYAKNNGSDTSIKDGYGNTYFTFVEKA